MAGAKQRNPGGGRSRHAPPPRPRRFNDPRPTSAFPQD